jgi:hypothetical protein
MRGRNRIYDSRISFTLISASLFYNVLTVKIKV